MSEKIGRVRIYQVEKGIGWIKFEDGSSDLPIYYSTLKKNGMELLKTGEKVLVYIEKQAGVNEITAIEKLDN